MRTLGLPERDAQLLVNNVVSFSSSQAMDPMSSSVLDVIQCWRVGFTFEASLDVHKACRVLGPGGLAVMGSMGQQKDEVLPYCTDTFAIKEDSSRVIELLISFKRSDNKITIQLSSCPRQSRQGLVVVSKTGWLRLAVVGAPAALPTRTQLETSGAGRWTPTKDAWDVYINASVMALRKHLGVPLCGTPCYMAGSQAFKRTSLEALTSPTPALGFLHEACKHMWPADDWALVADVVCSSDP